MTIEIRSIAPKDKTWLQQVMRNEFGSNRVVSRGVLHQVDHLPGFIAVLDNVPTGLLAYHVANGELEVVALSVTVPGRGMGSILPRGCPAAGASLWLPPLVADHHQR